MKTKLLIFLMLNSILAFGQANQNQSSNVVFNGFISPVGLGQQFGTTEIFRFRSGLVTQLDFGNNPLARMEAASFFMLFSSIKKIQRTAGNSS